MVFKLVLLSTFFIITLNTSAQIITTFAGGGSGSYPSDGGSATVAVLSDPCNGVFDKFGNYYFTDALGGNRVRKVNVSGNISTIAGTGISGFSGDGNQATLAHLKSPSSIVIDSAGNLYIADQGNARIRKIDWTTQIITTIAGNGIVGSTGDGSSATLASLGNPEDICLDNLGNLYVCESFGCHIRKINSAGIISNFAGNGTPGYSGNGCRADTAAIGSIESICMDKNGNMYASSSYNKRVFKINTSGIVNAVAGTNSSSYLFNADEISATTANIDPVRIRIDKFGNLFIAEVHNYRVRMVDKNGIIHTVAGIGTAGYSGDGGPATAAQLKFPTGIAFDSCDNLYIPEANNNRIRKVTYDKCNYLTVPEAATQAATRIYPTPITDALNIDNVAEKSNYKLYNLVGTVVNEGILYKGNNTIMLQGLPAGMYVLVLVGEDGKRTVQRVVKE